MTSELWLLAGVVAFHVYDATVLLYADELVAWPRRGGWSASVGGDTQWRGGFLFLPALWLPSQPLLRLQWLGVARPSQPTVDLASLDRALRPLCWAVWGMAALLFAALPLVLLYWRHATALLGLVAAIYLLSTSMVVYTVRRRHTLRLSRKDVVALAIDTLACPPFALNLVRKIGLRQSLAVDGLDFIQRRLSAETLQHLRPRLASRLDSLLLAEPDHSARALQLRTARDRLLEGSDGHA